MTAKKRAWAWPLIALLLLPLRAGADIAVLVHGYHASAASWEQSGVVTTLANNGWPRAGLYSTAAGTIRLHPAAAVDSDNSLYLVDLPSEAPLLLQADLLQSILQDIRRRHPRQPIILVGHSAGGVVSRIVLVRGSVGGISTLVTIAAPNLGTERSIQALNATDIPWPFNTVADMFAGEGYDTLRRSQGLLIDLLPAAPRTLLGWLNNQPHPDIDYYAIIRGHSLAMTGDWLVPGISQDLNNVPALAGRARVLTVPAGHELVALDGPALLTILNR